MSPRIFYGGYRRNFPGKPAVRIDTAGQSIYSRRCLSFSSSSRLSRQRSRRCDNKIDDVVRAYLVVCYLLLCFKQTRSAADSQSFHGRGDRKTDRLIGARRIGDQQLRRQRVRSACNTLYARAERLHIYCNIDPLHRLNSLVQDPPVHMKSLIGRDTPRLPLVVVRAQNDLFVIFRLFGDAFYVSHIFSFPDRNDS